MEIWLGIAIGFIASGLFVFALAYARAGNLQKATWGLNVAGRVHQNPSLEAKINALLADPMPTVPPPPSVEVSKPVVPPPPKPSGEPLRLLAVLQAESRLIDFLMEDISTAPDQVVGAGVKEVHRKATAALKKYLSIEPILGGTEGERITVQRGFDPSAVRVLGNVTGEPPYTGELQHPGWRVKEVKLPTVAEGQDQFVLQPAELQV